MTPAQQQYNWSWLAESGYWDKSLEYIETWESWSNEWRRSLPRIVTENQWRRLFHLNEDLEPRVLLRKNGLDPARLKQSILLSSIVEQYAPITARGGKFWARCPFHDEKHPSFLIDDAKGRWRCFGACGIGGDVIDFIMKKENLSFPQVLQILSAII